jgi:methylase of polypeptide subunit release factors
LSLLRRLVADCERRLQPRLLALEVAYGQARTVANLLAETGAATATVKDLGGIERVVTGRWPAW